MSKKIKDELQRLVVSINLQLAAIQISDISPAMKIALYEKIMTKLTSRVLELTENKKAVAATTTQNLKTDFLNKSIISED